MELVHVDIVGPISPKSLNGNCYFIPMYDDSRGISLVRFIAQKSDAPSAIKKMVNELERVQNCKIKRFVVKRVRSDNAKEFLSSELQQWLSRKVIIQELTPPYSPESNGRAERINRTLLDMARTMLLDCEHIPERMRLWAEAVNTANYIRNRMYTSASYDPNKTPYEIVMGTKPDLYHLRKFGSKGYVHIPKPRRKGNFDKRADVGYCVGYASVNGYKIYLPKSKEVIVSKDVSFDDMEDISTVYERTENSTEEDVSEGPLDNLIDQTDGNIGGVSQQTVPPFSHGHSSTEDNIVATEDDLEAVTHYPSLRRSSRQRSTPERFEPGMIALVAQLGNCDATTPLSYVEAMGCSDHKEWEAAMDAEMSSLNRNTWELVPLPANARPVRSKWVYSNKRDAFGNIIRRKARLVAKQFTQKDGVDYDEIFSPVVEFTTVRFMLVFACQQNLSMIQVDVKTAFLKAELDECIYMEQPEGYISIDYREHVYKLHRAIYGLKQAARAWHTLCDSLLKSFGCVRSSADTNLYNLRFSDELVFILVYVDDMLLIGKSSQCLTKTVNLISHRFGIRKKTLCLDSSEWL